MSAFLATSCIGCPSTSGHAGVIALAVVLLLAGAAGWVLLTRREPVLGRLVGAVLMLIGLALLVLQP